MEEKEIDYVAADTLMVGDIIKDSEGYLVEIAKVEHYTLEDLILVVHDRGEEEFDLDRLVTLYGY